MWLAVFVGALVVLAVCGGRPRISHWRGPQGSRMDGVQEEHLWLFQKPDDQDEE